MFFLNETATTEIYTYFHTLSLHDALPISQPAPVPPRRTAGARQRARDDRAQGAGQRVRRGVAGVAGARQPRAVAGAGVYGDDASPERAACGGERRRHRGFVGAACGAVVWVGMAATVRSESDPVLLCSSPRTATATACSTATSASACAAKTAPSSLGSPATPLTSRVSSIPPPSRNTTAPSP